MVAIRFSVLAGLLGLASVAMGATFTDERLNGEHHHPGHPHPPPPSPPVNGTEPDTELQERDFPGNGHPHPGHPHPPPINGTEPAVEARDFPGHGHPDHPHPPPPSNSTGDATVEVRATEEDHHHHPHPHPHPPPPVNGTESGFQVKVRKSSLNA